MTIGQFLIGALACVWLGSAVWAIGWAITRWRQRRAWRRRRLLRPHFPVVDVTRGQQLHAIMRGADRLRAGYQHGRDWRTP